MKAYAYIALVLSVIAFAVWYSNKEREAGYNEAVAEYEQKARISREASTRERNTLVQAHLDDMKKVKHGYEKQLQSIRSSQDVCALADTLPTIADRVRKERDTSAASLRD